MQRRRTTAPPKLKRPPHPGAWSLLVIDSSPIRQKAIREYEKVRRDLEKAKVELDRFRTEDQPQYAKWLNSHFGALLTETRELHEKLYAAQALITEVYDESFFGGHRSMRSAYAEVIRRRDHPEEFAAEMEQDEVEAEEFRKEFEEVFGKTAEEFFENLGGKPPPKSSPRFQKPASKPILNRLKDLYRALARRLHPDTGGPRSEREMEWWHQTQAAYQAGDIQKLELIITLADIEEKGANAASVSILQEIIRQFKQALKELQRELKQYRSDAAWNFSKLKDDAPILRRTRQMLEAEKARLTTLLERFQSEINTWKRPQKAASKGSRHREQPRRRSDSYNSNSWF